MENYYLPEGEILGTQENRDLTGSVYGLERAMTGGRIVEGVARMCDSGDMSLRVDLCGGTVIGMIPREEAVFMADGRAPKDIAIITRVGKAVCFKVMEIRRGVETQVVLSRREAQMECAAQYHAQLRCGDIIPARVTHLEPFGAFVDIGCGLVSLLSVDCISVSRISHPADRLAVRDRIMVVVKSMETESGRIYVSQKELLGTWEENVAGLRAGQTVAGIIRSIEEYGIFVELAPNLAGLAELCDENGGMRGVTPGQSCAVYIKSILPERMKIKLVLIDVGNRIFSERPPFRYYIDTDVITHLDKWRYSPENCRKVIETDFAAEACI